MNSPRWPQQARSLEDGPAMAMRMPMEDPYCQVEVRYWYGTGNLTPQGVAPPVASATSPGLTADTVESRCLRAMAADWGMPAVMVTRGGMTSAQQMGVLWFFNPVVRVPNTELTSFYRCVIFPDGRLDVSPTL
ncbi:hypothetical protein [Deinococcus yunweiensis]|uniref:hypothetical protein n=1 Tax=Deinococcus yunweiensis TaxID=367282 RepID=UPI00398F8319